MQVVDCYELAPHKGSVVLLDESMKVSILFYELSEQELIAFYTAE